LEYVFKANFDPDSKTPTIDKYIIQFYDKDGFKLEILKINSWTNMMDSTSSFRVGIIAYGSEDWKNEKKYLRIYNYDVSIINK
jgi:hypothetical protein